MTFDEFYAKNFKFAWRTLMALGVLERDVSDVVQDVFLQAHQKFQVFDAEAGGTAWLRAFCLNAARNWHRLSRNQFETNDDERAAQTPDERKGPEQSAVAQDQKKLLHVALQSVPEKQREVFVLFELEQMTSTEIATLLNIPLGTVYSRLRLGREAFQAAVLRLHPAVAP
jgi:RNA polymerase sigma-70 factor, ECF subfamily